MRKNRGALAGALLAAAAAGLVWLVLRPPVAEPVYNGRAISQYLNELATNWPGNPDYYAVEAIYQMGPRAVPYLRRAVAEADSPAERALRFIQAEFPRSIARALPAPKNIDYLRGLSFAAAQGLASFGPVARPAIPELVAAFTKDIPTANGSIFAMMEIGLRPGDAPAILSCLKSTNWWVPAFAMRCLGEAGATNAEIIGLLTAAARHGTQWERWSAIDALSKLGSNNLAAAAALAANLADPEAVIRAQSAVALRKIRAEAAPPAAWFANELEREIRHGSPRSASRGSLGYHELTLLALANALGEFGDGALTAVPLLRGLKDDTNLELNVRLAAAQDLWKLANETNGIALVYQEGLRSPDFNLRLRAAQGLSEFCVQSRAGRPELTALVSSEDSFVRFYAARGLWKLTGQAEPYLPILVAGLSDHATYYYNSEIRELAAATLGEMGAKAKPAAPSLVSALSDVREKVRRAATNALKRINTGN